ncbi:uncharacterized protein CEXT_642311 [Caerostris extrusa]|uniref:Uncharacterized protein n=1 Tax=Caerostris extrusa TaxID=172846 RepID=A0AAV4V9C5_CAEEX|nr:uncharacterized protein CEXT_642311 [Caerostris extrusa]
MSSMGVLNFYLILIVVLVVVLFVLVIILIVFRDSFRNFCNCCRRQDSEEDRLNHGLGNPAFDDHEYAQRLRALPEQRPFSVMESVESPPSYEEAVKQELFRFRLPVTIQRTQRSTSLTEISVPREMSPTAAAESFESRPSTSSAALTQQQNEPSTSQGICQNPRKRSSTTGSNGMLSTISEEDSERDETPHDSCHRLHRNTSGSAHGEL